MPLGEPGPREASRADITALHERIAARGRGCGDCTACCTVMAVDMHPLPAPPKPERTKCSHLCKKGCGIYESKPESCSVFMCMWLATQAFDEPMPVGLRPDRSGAVIDVNMEGTMIAHLQHEDAWHRRPALREWLTAAARRMTVILNRPSGDNLRLLGDGSTEELVHMGVGLNGLNLYRTKHAWER